MIDEIQPELKSRGIHSEDHQRGLFSLNIWVSILCKHVLVSAVMLKHSAFEIVQIVGYLRDIVDKMLKAL